MTYESNLIDFCVKFLKSLGITKEDIDSYENGDMWEFLNSGEVADKCGIIGENLMVVMAEEMISNVTPSANEVYQYVSVFSRDDFIELLQNSSDDVYGDFATYIAEHAFTSQEMWDLIKNDNYAFSMAESVLMNSVCFGYPDEYMDFFSISSGNYEAIYNEL